MSFEGGPWGIVVIISAFMIQVFVFGVSGTIGVYNIKFLEYFQASASEVSVISALNSGAFFASGPLVSFLMTKMSYRKVTLGGSVLVVLGLLIIPIFPNLYVIYLGLGLLAGFGGSCTYVPSHTLSAEYYDKYRSLATGIVTSGSGLGSAITPILTAWFIEMYTWKESFYLLAAFTFQVIIFASLMRSPPEMSGNSGGKNEKSILIEKPETSFGTVATTEIKTKCTSDVLGAADVVDVDKESSIRSEASSQNDDELKDQPPTIENTQLPDTARHIFIFKNYNFVIYSINNYLWNASISSLGSFNPNYFSIQGHSMTEVSWIVGIAGFGIFLGGILGGLLGNIKGMNRTHLYTATCFLIGINTMLLPSGDSFAYAFSIMLLSGVLYGVVLGLLVAVLADIVGMESLSNGMGYLMLSTGLGTFTGPIFGGILIDVTSSYEMSVYFAGILTLVSGAVMCLIPIGQYFKSCRKTSST